MKKFKKNYTMPCKTNLLIVLVLFFALPCMAQRLPYKLRCEYLENPIGLDVETPRFTWQILSSNSGEFQEAWQLFVDKDSVNLLNGKGMIWESGIVNSSSIPVVYNGQKLDPFTRYYWSVKIQGKMGNWSELSEIASFETGMMTKTNWKGNWITDTYDINLKQAPYFRKTFKSQKKIKTARAYIAVAGLYELYINGKKIGNHSLDPMFTRFDRRTLYLTYDVTKNLQNGENVIGVLLGNGWYNHQSTAVWYFDKAPWRARPKFCMDMRIGYDDGSEEVISTGEDWKTAGGSVIFNSIYTGEHVDARLEQPGWNMPGFDDSKWNGILLTGCPSQNIVAQALQPIRIKEKIDAKEMIKLDSSTFLFNFGRNIAGVSQLKVSGTAGTTIRLKHAEKLGPDARVDQTLLAEHYRPTDNADPFQTDIYILKGEGEESFMPRFNYKGFQYVEVTSDKPIKLSKESITAYFMHSDVPPAGSIHSSNATLNKIWKAGNASYLSNLFGYPTDCPQREKNGWTGDAHICIETGLYNFDAITIYEKWMADHQDEQQPNGVLPAIIPTSGWGYHWANGTDYTSTIAIIPWNIYLFYGDSHLLVSCYQNIKRYVDYITGISHSGLTDWGLGDWAPVKSETPKEFTSSIYYYVDADILAKVAKILGNQNDFEKYTALAETIKKAINDKYLNRQTMIYGSGFQTELSAALKWGIVPQELKSQVAGNLAKKVIADGNHIDVGLLGSKTILNALSENGYADIAYKVASQETFPSWGWWIVNGATTLSEQWAMGGNNDKSLNHIMFGEISAWYYKGLGGIFPDESQPGFKNVILKPNFVTGLDQFEAKHNGPYGTIISSWKKSKGKTQYEVSIPANSTATFYFKASAISEQGKSLSENKQIKVVKSEYKDWIIKLEAGNFMFSIKE